jgi:hypothetical protein
VSAEPVARPRENGWSREPELEGEEYRGDAERDREAMASEAEPPYAGERCGSDDDRPDDDGRREIHLPRSGVCGRHRE